VRPATGLATISGMGRFPAAWP